MRRVVGRVLVAVALAAAVAPGGGCDSSSPASKPVSGGKQPPPDLELNQGGDAVKGKPKPAAQKDSNKEAKD